MEDNELIASFEPRLKGWVLVLAYDDLEEMLLDQERIQASHRQTRDDEGAPLPQVETLWMGESQFGERLMMSDQIKTGLLVATAAGIQEIEEARRAWAQSRMQAQAAIVKRRGMSEAWNPSTEQMDLLGKMVEQVVEPHPAGNAEWTPRIKISVAREGFRQFCLDHDRPDLAFRGSNGGKAFSAALQMLLPYAAVRPNEARSHSYLHGVRRQDGANRRYFRLP